METKSIEDIADIKAEIKFMSKTLVKLEKVLEDFSAINEKQNVANKRLLKLENHNEIQSWKIRKLEDWQLKMITISALIATIGSTIIWLVLKKYFH